MCAIVGSFARQSSHRSEGTRGEQQAGGDGWKIGVSFGRFKDSWSALYVEADQAESLFSLGMKHVIADWEFLSTKEDVPRQIINMLTIHHSDDI